MNFYALLSFCTSILYLLMGIYILRLDFKAGANRVFAILSFCFFIWAFSYSFIYTETNTKILWTWYRISMAGWCLIPFIALFMAYRLTKKSALPYWLHVLLFIPPIALIIKGFSGVLLADGFIMINGTNYEILNTQSPWLWFYIAYYFSYMLGSFIVLFVNYCTTKNTLAKKQYKIIIVTGLISLFLASVTDVILPILNDKLIPSISQIMTLVWLGGIWYAIDRYRLLMLTPMLAVNEITTSIIDLVVLTDPELNITQVNRSALNILGYQEADLLGKSVDTVLYDQKVYRSEFIQKIPLVKPVYIWEMDCKSKDGEKVSMNISISPFFDRYKILIGYIFIGQDLRLIRKLELEIIQRNKAELALKRARDDLELKVLERTKELEYYATTDSMTGVYNRRIGLVMLEKEIQRSLRTGVPFTICFVDLNNLKWVNDNFGHKEGDEYIRGFTSQVIDCLRASDIVCRMGGDEFLIILPECDATRCEQVCLNIKEKMKDMYERHEKPYNISFSYGIVEYNAETHKCIDDLIAKADQEMYQNKKCMKELELQNENKINLLGG